MGGTRTRRSALVVGVLAGISSIAIAGWITVSGDSDRPRMVASQSFYVWGDTPHDWVSWADEIAVVNIVGEEQIPLDPRRIPGGEGFVGRRIEATIEETLWRHPDGPEPPPLVSLKTTDGWWYQRGPLLPSKDVGAHRSEVGDRLLVAMFHMKDWGWTLMSGGVLLGADGRTKIDTDQTDIGHRIEGMTLPQLRETFRTAQPFAVVTKYRHLDPEARMRAVYEAGQKRGDAPGG